MRMIISPMPRAIHSPYMDRFCISHWTGNDLLERDCLLGYCLAGLAPWLGALLASQINKISHPPLVGYLHKWHSLNLPCKRETKLNCPGICQWNPPSQAYYPSLRTCINCWNLSNVSPASVAGSICDTFQISKVWKFTSWIHGWSWKWITAHKKWSNKQLQVGPKKNHHIFTSMTDWKINIFSVFLTKTDIKR